MSALSRAEGRRVLIFGIHNTVEWWHALGQHMGWDEATVITDLRGEGDISIVDAFYTELRRTKRRPDPGFTLLSAAQKQDVIARCRTLRWLAPDLAQAMTEAMAVVLECVLERTRPRVVLSFPIDRYVMHVLRLLAERRGATYVELTASVIPSMSMLMVKGRLAQVQKAPDDARIAAEVAALATPNFTPSYVPRKTSYTRAKFVRTLGYFRTRALALKAISYWQRDPLNLHYLDAQPMLGHKCRWKDIRIVDLVDPQWRAKVEIFPRERRALFGLQLFPEASIDYWLENPALIDYDNLVVRAARAFSDAGFVVMVKDHPLQFGFRQTELIDRLLAIPRAVIVPYAVSGNELMALAGVNFTCTGTMGLQSALQGIYSVVAESYYSNDDDFIVFREPADVDRLPQRVLAADLSAQPLQQRQHRMISHLLRGSIDGDFFSFKGYRRDGPTSGTRLLAQALGRRLDELVEQGSI